MAPLFLKLITVWGKLSRRNAHAVASALDVGSPQIWNSKSPPSWAANIHLFDSMNRNRARISAIPYIAAPSLRGGKRKRDRSDIDKLGSPAGVATG